MLGEAAELALVVSSTPRLSDVIWHSSLVIVRRATGGVIRVVSDKVQLYGTPPVWSPDGRKIAFAEFPPNPISSWLALAPAAGGAAEPLIEGYQGTILQVEWEPDSEHLLAESIERTKDMRISCAR